MHGAKCSDSDRSHHTHVFNGGDVGRCHTSGTHHACGRLHHVCATTPGGYRFPLYVALTNAGYSIDYVGTLTSNGATGLPDSDHEGHDGWKISDASIGVYEKILSWLSVIADPDVVLLHLGTNDSGDGTAFTNAVDRLDDLVTRIATNRPYAHIIVTSLLPRGGSRYTAITNYFNPYVPGKVAEQQTQGHRVTFLDMHAYVTTNDMYDALHPTAVGYTNMANAWFTAITNVISPQGDWAPPAIVRAAGSADNRQVSVTFSKPVEPASATDSAHYALSGGLTFSNATLSADQRTVTLNTSLQAYGSNYVVTVNDVTDITATPGPFTIAANSTVSFQAATPRGYRTNIAESTNYTLVYSLDLPNTANYRSSLVPYTVDNSIPVGAFSRVAYYLELQSAGGPLQYLWASMDAFTNRADKLGVPTPLSGAIYQNYVSNLNVFCNVPGVINGTNLVGNIEFWPSDYTGANAAGIPGAAGSYDFGDQRLSAGNHGSMQLHNYVAKQTLFAFNNWGGAGTYLAMGIGNQPSGNPDWTLAYNATNFTVKTLQVLVLRDTSDSTPPIPTSAQAGPAGSVIIVTFPEPVDTSSVEGTRFALDNGVSVLSATLLPDLRTVCLTTTPQPFGVSLTLTVGGIRDTSPAANAVPAGTTLAVTKYEVPPEVAANAGTLANGYTLIYALDIPTVGNFNASPAFYRYDQGLAAGVFDRVAYYVELQKIDGTFQYVWVSMDAFTNRADKLGVPTAASGAVYQRHVSNLDVASNVAGITNGTGLAGGSLEFWASDYTATNSAAIPGASDTVCDFGDSIGSAVAGSGSMQIHNSTFGHTLFALNKWGKDGVTLEMGIGNQSTGNKDWTGAANAASFTRRTLYVLIRPVAPPALPPEVTARVPGATGYHLAYTIDLPTNGSFNTSSPTYYSVNNTTNGLPDLFSRIAYYLELQSGSDPTQFIWTAMDAFTADARRIGVPTNNCHFQQRVTRLDVLSNVDGIANGMGLATGNIEFWPLDYGSSNASNVPNASSSTYDLGDVYYGTGDYGSMQVHNYGATQTLFAVNNFNNNHPLCIGIGNCPSPTNGGVDWTFKTNADTYNHRRLHVFVLPGGNFSAPDTTRPTLVNVAASRSLNQVAIGFSRTLADNAATPSFFTLNNGATVTGARLLPSKKDVVLTTSALTAGQAYTVSVTGVRDRSSGNLILPGSTISFIAPTASETTSSLTNVTEAATYTLIYQLAISNTVNYVPGGAPYSVDESRFMQAQPFDRVAYCLDLKGTNGVSQWVYVSMNAFTNDLTKIGVPTTERGVIFQQYVSNMNVYASANAAVTTGVGITAGNIEFWPCNYNQSNSKGITGANGGTYDFGDNPTGTGTNAGHGCMQVHNYLAAHTILSMTHFGYNGITPGLGIGNNTSTADPDWTLTYSAPAYAMKNLYVLAHAVSQSEGTGTQPDIWTQPQSRHVRAGEPVVFSVFSPTATSYQWRKNGVSIPGATQSSLEFNPAEVADAGRYDVLVCSAGGTALSNSATLSVTRIGMMVILH